ncbi:mechanosensitive ion channel [Rhodomicrobium sp. Az07]|uniref:mechanosensitive ion channel family protein n=1 Tax=Rhodomicrobium sp. Az07 TaxID=2839034 RepID=UPI001BE8ED45|nr:mechanosensitive ion channel domain-containing protein [Rhodomicrobium sp. Az07]MBT3070215.1 mechanosensitive ion channel [Rhodomicrobium sp. Az07]
MALRHWILACFLSAALIVPNVGAFAQDAAAKQAAPAAAAPAPKAATPEANKADVIKRANDAFGADIAGTTAKWLKTLDDIEDQLRKPGLRYKELNAFRDQLLRIRSDADEFWKKLEPAIRAIDEQGRNLPPVPAADQPPETGEAALLRADLAFHLSHLNSARATLDHTHSRVNQLINSIQDIRRKNFTNNLFQPVQGIWSLQTWENVPAYADMAINRAESTIRNWWAESEGRSELLYLFGTALALFAGLSLLSWRGVRHLRTWTDDGAPPFWRRASTAAGVIVLRVIPACLPLVFLYHAMNAAQPVPGKIQWLLYSASGSILVIVGVNALITTVFAPGRPQWRLIPATEGAAVRISGLMLALALIYGATTFLYTVTRVVQAPFSLTLAFTLPANLLVALLVAAILRTPLRDKTSEGLPRTTWLNLLRLPVWLVTAAIIVTAFSGYLSLSRFLAQQLIVTGSILAVVYILLLWADGVAQGMSDENSAIGGWIRALGIDQKRCERFSVPISLSLKFIVLVGAVPLILLQWGYPWADVLEWYYQLFFGFRIGNTQVSLAAFLAAIVVFVLGYFAARLFQSWLDTQVLKPAGLSGGLRDSIRTGVGYIGVGAAALIALSYAGLNLSNLAIVAGALSVGIGFGLQSVVSNFVSGLILLAERPIKVGDLVTVGGEEGTVRKISVRSTEIETYDRASVLVPNSSFITGNVKNWTLRNNTTRVVIPVSALHGSDPRKVKEVLLDVARSHVAVMTSPEPFVSLDDFTVDALQFKLYAYIYDLNKGLGTKTELRMGIIEAFRKEGIQMPRSALPALPPEEAELWREAVSLYVASRSDKDGEDADDAPNDGRIVLPRNGS